MGKTESKGEKKSLVTYTKKYEMRNKRARNRKMGKSESKGEKKSLVTYTKKQEMRNKRA